MDNLSAKKTRIGHLDQIIEIQTPTYSTSVYGEQLPAWTPAQTLYANVAYNTTGQNEDVSGQTIKEYRPVTFTIRYRTNVSSKDRIYYAGEEYDIENIAHEGRKRFTKLVCILRR
jgi:phage head-tail adaptor, putative, SPP1 family